MKTNFSRSLYILLPLLLAACGPLAPTPTVTPSVTSAPSSTPTLPPTETPTPEPQQPPACTFLLEQMTMGESKPESYTFSEPRVVLAGPKGNFEIVEWLPDSQRALIVRTIYENHYEQYQSIELLDPSKTNVQVYAKRDRLSNTSPLWVAGLDALIYPERKVASYSYDENGTIIEGSIILNPISHLLWLSNGNPDTAKKLKDVQFNSPDEPDEWNTIAKPDGSQVIYLEATGENSYQIHSRMVSQGSLENEQLIPFKLALFPNNERPINYDMVWRPNTTQILLSSSKYIPGGSYSFLFDTNTGKICSLDFGNTAWGARQWALVARWSPNGRYLAVIRTTGSIPIDFSDLAVLDTVTGNLYTMAFSPQDVEGRRYVWDIAWAPDNYHLAATGRVSAFQHCDPNCMDDVNRLYLVDFISGNADLLFPSFQFTGGGLGDSLAWSPDGTKILANCWAESTGRLCLVPVQRTPQP